MLRHRSDSKKNPFRKPQRPSSPNAQLHLSESQQPSQAQFEPVKISFIYERGEETFFPTSRSLARSTVEKDELSKVTKGSHNNLIKL